MGRNERIVVYGLLGLLIVMVLSFFFIKEKIIIFGERTASVFFLQYEEGTKTTYLVAVTRTIPRTDNIEEKIKVVIGELLKGPDEKEKADGLNTAMPEDATLIDVKVEGNIAFLDFSKEIEQGGGTALMTDRLAQIVYTATQFPPVDKVRLLINGEAIKYFSGEGLTDVENPMGRDNFNYTIKTGG